MNYLKYSEISEKSIVMIDFEDGPSKPYYIDSMRKGNISAGTMLLGELLETIVEKHHHYPCRKGSEDRYYTGSDEHPDGGNSGVVGYRLLTEEEKSFWLLLVESIKELKDLIPLLD